MQIATTVDNTSFLNISHASTSSLIEYSLRPFEKGNETHIRAANMDLMKIAKNISVSSSNSSNVEELRTLV